MIKCVGGSEEKGGKVYWGVKEVKRGVKRSVGVWGLVRGVWGECEECGKRCKEVGVWGM